jgi:beta-galactosidase beta subunit
MKFDNYFLDLEKVNSLPSKEEREQIHRYYVDMMIYFTENRTSMGMSIFNTLNQADYLKELRTEKIDKILS